MILKTGDVIPVRTVVDQWATYYGRVIGFDPKHNEIIVVNRDTPAEHKRVAYHEVKGFYFYLQLT